MFIRSILFLCLLLVLGECLAMALNPGAIFARKPEMRSPVDIIAATAKFDAGNYILVLGDSVMRASTLKRHGVADAESKTIPAFLQKQIKKVSPEAGVVSLAMEGMLLNDFRAVIGLLLQKERKPGFVLLQIDYRLLSRTHDPKDHLAREWLSPYLHAAAGSDSFEYGKGTTGYSRPVDIFIYNNVLLSSELFLFLSRLRPHIIDWYNPGEAAAEIGDDTDLLLSQEQKLLLKVGQYYRSDDNLNDSRSFDLLVVLARELARKKIPTLICFTPANFAFLGSQANVAVYMANLNNLEKRFRATPGIDKYVRFYNMERMVPYHLFLDHGHFTAAGNEMVAGIISQEVILHSNNVSTVENAF